MSINEQDVEYRMQSIEADVMQLDIARKQGESEAIRIEDEAAKMWMVS